MTTMKYVCRENEKEERTIASFLFHDDVSLYKHIFSLLIQQKKKRNNKMHGMRRQELLVMRSELCDQLTCKLNNLTELAVINRLLPIFHLFLV